MKTFVAYDNPMQALSRRYAVFRGGKVVDRLSTKKAALNAAIRYCSNSLEQRLGLDPAQWPDVVERAKQDAENIKQLMLELKLEDVEIYFNERSSLDGYGVILNRKGEYVVLPSQLDEQAIKKIKVFCGGAVIFPAKRIKFADLPPAHQHWIAVRLMPEMAAAAIAVDESTPEHELPGCAP